MRYSYAILLDAGFLRHKLGTSRNPANAAGVRLFTEQVSALPCVADMHLHRIYFYDAKPLDFALEPNAGQSANRVLPVEHLPGTAR